MFWLFFLLWFIGVCLLSLFALFCIGISLRSFGGYMFHKGVVLIRVPIIDGEFGNCRMS